MTRALPLFAAALCLLSLAPRRAEACSCVPPPPPQEALKGAAAVFVGKVLSVDKQRDERRHVIALEVERRFKGEVADVTHLYTNRDSAACGRNFEPGERYLVYAEAQEKALVDHLCTRTQTLESAREDLAALEAAERGEAPPDDTRPILDAPPPTESAPPAENPTEAPPARTDVPAEPPGRSPGASCQAASGAGPLALVGLLLLRRRRGTSGPHGPSS